MNKREIIAKQVIRLVVLFAGIVLVISARDISEPWGLFASIVGGYCIGMYAQLWRTDNLDQ